VELTGVTRMPTTVAGGAPTGSPPGGRARCGLWLSRAAPSPPTGAAIRWLWTTRPRQGQAAAGAEPVSRRAGAPGLPVTHCAGASRPPTEAGVRLDGRVGSAASAPQSDHILVYDRRFSTVPPARRSVGVAAGNFRFAERRTRDSRRRSALRKSP
jgi:hypothetical protein